MKLSLFKGDVENISKLSDRPNIENGYTSNTLKALFDKSGVDIKEYINTVLIEELASTAFDASGAERIGSAIIDTVPGETVQEKLVALSNQINGLANGTIPDGSITPEKFSPVISAFLTSASIRSKVFDKPGEHSFAVERSGTYKFTMSGGGAGGGVDPSNIHHQLGGGGGASVILWIDLKEGDSCTLSVGEGGEGMTTDGTAFVSHAKAGGNTMLTVNGKVIATAEGGMVGKERRAMAIGGSINHNGGYPKSGKYYGTTGGEVVFDLGGDSFLGEGAAYISDVPGIGGGGYAGKYHGSGVYKKGYSGGNGCVIVEYMM